MPGLGFLLKKGFHPSRVDNQKKLFVAENEHLRQGEIEREHALQKAKDREIAVMEERRYAESKDPRDSSLRFMYAAPANIKQSKASHLLAVPSGPALDENGDDEQVRAFKAKLAQRGASSAQPPSSSSIEGSQARDSTHDARRAEKEKEAREEQAGEDRDDEDDEGEGEGEGEAEKQAFYAPLSELEKLSGIKRRAIVTAEEMARRHPILKNAPTAGEFTQTMKLYHKPFNGVVRNVQCKRCGVWGHAIGDRECKLSGITSSELERQRREDPMSSLHVEALESEDDGAAEASYIASLSRKEKKKLLKQLLLQQQKGESSDAQHTHAKSKKTAKHAKHSKHKDHGQRSRADDRPSRSEKRRKRDKHRKNSSSSSDSDSSSSSEDSRGNPS